jgi:hypothetical protein
MTPLQAAARLAGGFIQPISRDDLLRALQSVLHDSDVDLGELMPIQELPGMPRAAAATLTRVWTAGLKLEEIGNDHPRVSAVVNLEKAVLARLPRSARKPVDIVQLAVGKMKFAPMVLGPVSLHGVPDLDPVLRPFLLELAKVTPVTWIVDSTDPPSWILDTDVILEPSKLHSPEIVRVSCANPRHEALEAMRWVRAVLASGDAKSEEIAIAAPDTSEWDAHLAVVAADANIPLAFVHGRSCLTTRDGQAATALADVILKGLSQNRVHRLVSLIRSMNPITSQFPDSWKRTIRFDASPVGLDQWGARIASIQEWPENQDFSAPLTELLCSLDRGMEIPAEIGEQLLSGRALDFWRKALLEGPPQALDISLANIYFNDDIESATSVVWCNASDLAASPRPYVRLLGLTSRGWPRTQREDFLLPSHIVDPELLDPVPVPERDRRDFATILSASAKTVVLSRPRRDGEGRQTGESPLLHRYAATGENYLRRERTPTHAVSEADRLLARPDEFRATAQLQSADQCWRDWQLVELTPHDGIVHINQPPIERCLNETFSATRLRTMVRDPLGFIWKYVLHWGAPAVEEDLVTLDALQYGSLVHNVLERTLVILEQGVGFAKANDNDLAEALTQGVAEAGHSFIKENPVPPRAIWIYILDDAKHLALAALKARGSSSPGQRSFAEVPFGNLGDDPDPNNPFPWDPTAPVQIPGTDLNVRGFIDRLDLSGDTTSARVTDYKTGKAPRNSPVVSGGAELQRCIYASAIRSLLGNEIAVEASLLFPHGDGVVLTLADPWSTIETVSTYIVAARDHIRAGATTVGIGSGERADDPLTFALPANAKNTYLQSKTEASGALLAPLPELWEMD